MVDAIEGRAIEMKIEVAIIGRELHDLLRFDELFREPAMSDQALDSADAQAMFLPELHQLRQPRHRSVIVQNFAENPGRLESRHPREIHGRFRVTGATEHTVGQIRLFESLVAPWALPIDRLIAPPIGQSLFAVGRARVHRA